MNEAERMEVLARLARLERLEEQVFFQEQTISALNEALTGQQRQLDLLEGRLAVPRKRSEPFGNSSARTAAF